jgi:carbonic anhydrase
MRFITSGGAFLISVTILGIAQAGTQEQEVFIEKLFRGNQIFYEYPRDSSPAKRHELAAGQHPFATIISCSDSRVVPEYIFDQGLGDIFVIRVAGNVIDPVVLGSIEYGVEHLHTPLLVILGHSQCGAVTAAVDALDEPHGNIGAILKKIMPAAAYAKSQARGRRKILDIAVHENIRNTYQDILANSPIVKRLVDEDELKVVGAEYYTDSGKVEIMDLSAPWKPHEHTESAAEEE